jgi:methyl-accepting chemotaxis protein
LQEAIVADGSCTPLRSHLAEEKMRIGSRLRLGFGSILSLLLCIAGLSIYGMHEANNSVQGIVRGIDAEKELLSKMSEATHIVSTSIRTAVLLSNKEDIEKELENVDEATAQYKEADTALRRFSLDDREKKLLEQTDACAAEALPIDDLVISLAKENKDEEATRLLLTRAGDATTSWQNALKSLIKLQSDQAMQAEMEVEQSYWQMLRLTLGLAGLAFAAGGLISWKSTRSITGPIKEAVRIAQTVACANLTSTIDTSAKDETGDLLRALKKMNDSLVNIVGEVREGAVTIASASQQIARGNLDLSARTEQQAGSLEETAASMEELNSTVKHNADNARRAHVLANKASTDAINGCTMVGSVVNTMDDISASAQKIASIIAVVDDIAFQTNILALNAAVEAARAGEQGRGFAVVASEVRDLAQRSATAAKEIKELITASSEKVDLGSRLVHEAGTAMQGIVESIKHVSVIIEEINNATREQASGIHQVTEAVSEMDQMTQQNAALVEEAAAATASLNQQAEGLEKAVGIFRLDHDQSSDTEVEHSQLPGDVSTANLRIA